MCRCAAVSQLPLKRQIIFCIDDLEELVPETRWPTHCKTFSRCLGRPPGQKSRLIQWPAGNGTPPRQDKGIQQIYEWRPSRTLLTGHAGGIPSQHPSRAQSGAQVGTALPVLQLPARRRSKGTMTELANAYRIRAFARQWMSDALSHFGRRRVFTACPLHGLTGGSQSSCREWLLLRGIASSSGRQIL